MAKKTLPLPGEIVKKSNAVARAVWSINSVYEPRLVALVASKVRQDDEDFRDYEIPMQEIIGDAADGRTYKLLSDTVDNLMGKVITIAKPNGWAKCAIFSYCEYDAQKGTINCRFDPAMKPHYLKLSEKFTQYSLMEFLSLPSIYSQRLYEILKSWKDKPEVELGISDLHKILDVPISLKKDFAAFRRRVLEKAHKDITEKTDLVYDWEAIKEGRSVVAVRFTFTKKRTQKLAKEKQLKRQRANSQRNNKLGVAAVKCFESHGKVCNQENPKTKRICEVCKMLHPK